MKEDAKGVQHLFGKVEYVLASIYFAYFFGFIIIWTQKKFEINVDSKNLLHAVIGMAISCLLCIVVSINRCRRLRDVFLNVIVSLEIFLMAPYVGIGPIYTALCAILLAVTFLLAAIVFFFLQKSDKEIGKKNIVEKAQDVLILERLLLAIAFPIVIVLLVLTPQLARKKGPDPISIDKDLLCSGYSYKRVYGDEYELSNIRDKISPIRNSEEWENLPLEQKKEIITAILECEFRYFGIPYEVTINFVDRDNYYCGGHSLVKNEVDINIKDLESLNNEDMLLSVLHEAKHVYQKCICDLYLHASDEEKALYLFFGVDDWCEGFYKFTYGTLDEPIIQSDTEYDAYLYARNVIDDYLKKQDNP